MPPYRPLSRYPSATARDTAQATSRTVTGVNVPTDVLTAALSGRDPKRLAQWHNSTQGQQMGGVAGLTETISQGPMARTERTQQYPNRTLLGQQMEQNMQRNRYDLEKDLASDAAARQQAEQEAMLQGYIGNRRADVLEAQYPGTGTVMQRNPALEAAIDFNRMGQFDAADDVLKMGTAPAAPKPTATQRNHAAFLQALQQGDYALAALYMDSIEEPIDQFGTLRRRQATAEDARAYWEKSQSENGAAPAEAPAQAVDMEAVQESVLKRLGL